MKTTTLMALATTAMMATSLSAQDQTMSFFVTSGNPGAGADLGGLAGADAHCAALAQAVGAGDKTWRAYLSTTAENARDRIGAGPWYNAEGIEIAAEPRAKPHQKPREAVEMRRPDASEMRPDEVTLLAVLHRHRAHVSSRAHFGDQAP